MGSTLSPRIGLTNRHLKKFFQPIALCLAETQMLHLLRRVLQLIPDGNLFLLLDAFLSHQKSRFNSDHFSTLALKSER